VLSVKVICVVSEESEEVESLSCNWMPLGGVVGGGAKKRFVNGAVEGRLEVRISRSVSRLEDP